MYKLVLALALGSAAAFQPAARAPARSVRVAGKSELIELAESNTDALGAAIGFWDPLGASDLDFWGLGEEGTVGYLRHAEIKHGRVAMAGFLGFCAQCTDVVKGPHEYLPYRGYVENVSPQEQWDNIPLIGKLQILTFVGMLESYGEGAGCDESEYIHYTKGGLPGFYPSIKGKGLYGQLVLDLYDPFGILPEQTEEEKERGRRVEINNGRAPMLGLFAVLSESKGLIVPPLDMIEGFPKDDGNVMIPFSNDFSIIN
jgi:hypothetical protein